MDEDEAALALVGTAVAEKYRLLSLLGAGGMGAVYEAEHVFTKRRVAVKRMHSSIARSKHAADRFIREAQAPSAIGHPGIVQVLDGGFDVDGSLYLVLELLEGVSMEDALEQRTLELPALLQIGIELLEALAAAHARGFIHRDIKPDNVFLADDGRGSVTVKLLDFGIASLHTQDGNEKLTKTGSVLGTPLYMSPEQAQGAPIDARSDLWSVGAMLYRALAGRAPYDGDTYNALIVSIVSKEHPPLSQARPDLPAALLEIVERAMKKQPDARFDSAEQMCAALKAVSLAPVTQRAQLPVTPRRPAAANPRPVAVQDGETHVRGPSLASWAIGIGACAALVLGVLWVRAKSPQVRDGRAQLSAAEAAMPPHAQTEPVPVLQEPAKAEPAVAAPGPDAPAVEPALANAVPSAAAQPPTTRAVAEGLPSEALAKVLEARQPELQRCLEEAVVAQMVAGGAQPQPLRLDITLNIAQTGRVSDAQVHGTGPEGLVRCVRASLSAATFPPAAAPTVFRYPLVLAPTIIGR